MNKMNKKQVRNIGIFSIMTPLASAFKKTYAFLFARKAFYPIHLFFYKLSLTGMGIRNYENDYLSGEKAFIRYLLEHGRLRDGVILDVGANIGHYSIMLRQNHIRLPIYAFEPHPAAFRLLEQAAREHAFMAIPEGAGDMASVATIYDYSGNGGSEHASMYREVIEHLHRGQAQGSSILLTTIDDFVERNQIDHIALLKIDTEGHELPVLKGAQHTLANGLAEVIQIEFNEMNVISRTFFKDLVEILPGYDFYRLLPDGLQPLGAYNTLHYEIFAFQNIVALRRKHS